MRLRLLSSARAAPAAAACRLPPSNCAPSHLPALDAPRHAPTAMSRSSARSLFTAVLLACSCLMAQTAGRAVLQPTPGALLGIGRQGHWTAEQQEQAGATTGTLSVLPPPRLRSPGPYSRTAGAAALLGDAGAALGHPMAAAARGSSGGRRRLAQAQAAAPGPPQGILVGAQAHFQPIPGTNSKRCLGWAAYLSVAMRASGTSSSITLAADAPPPPLPTPPESVIVAPHGLIPGPVTTPGRSNLKPSLEACALACGPDPKCTGGDGRAARSAGGGHRLVVLLAAAAATPTELRRPTRAPPQSSTGARPTARRTAAWTPRAPSRCPQARARCARVHAAACLPACLPARQRPARARMRPASWASLLPCHPQPPASSATRPPWRMGCL